MIKVGIIGFGTVGTGVVKILFKNRDLIRRRVGEDIVVARIADIDLERDRDLGFSLPRDILTRDASEIIEDEEIDIVVELVGGIEPARSFILEAMEKGKSVVTANKKLLAEKGSEIFERASQKGVELGFEASVGGGIPIIKPLKESLAGDRIEKIYGILNGTANYILTKMTFEGSSYQSALRDAQEKGFAEADPALDVRGIDAAHKLSILSSISFGVRIPFDSLYREGIEGVTPLDIKFSEEFGYRIKLLAIAKMKSDGRLELRVHPTLIPFEHLLSKIDWEYNAIYVEGESVGRLIFYGKGAGMMPTGAAVVGDIIDVARNIRSGAKSRVPVLSFEKLDDASVVPMDELKVPYYIRFQAVDRPGVLSKISGILGSKGISISQVIQKGRGERGVPIVMITHEAVEKDLMDALGEIGKLDVVLEKPFFLRIETLDG